jgi:hypothetical protein
MAHQAEITGKFPESEVGKLTLALQPEAPECPVEDLQDAEVNLKLLELRALVARLRVMRVPAGNIAVPNIDPTVSSALDSDLLLELQTEMNPQVGQKNEYDGTVNRMKDVMTHSEVLQKYAELYNRMYQQIQTAKQLLHIYRTNAKLSPLEKVAIVRQLSRLLNNLVSWCEDEEQNVHNQVVREGRGYRDTDILVLQKLDAYRSKCETEMAGILRSDIEAQIQLRKDQISLDRSILARRVPAEVKKRSKGLSGGFISTPDRKEIIEGTRTSPKQSIVSALRKRHNVELFGPTGTGKTQLAIQGAKQFSGKPPVLISGEPGLNRYTFLGQLKGSNQRYEGALITCLKEGRILLVDEDNRIDPRALAVIKFALGLKVGDVYEHPDTGEKIPVPPGFGVAVTRNEYSKHHKDRYPLPPEYRREFTLASFEVGYFPKEEMYERFLLPRLCKDDGSMNLTASEVGGDFQKGDRSPLLSFAVAAEEIQKLYMNNEINAVFESGFMIDVFSDWHEQHIRTKCTFLQYIEEKLHAFVMRPLDNPTKQAIIKVLIGQGFFVGKTEADFMPKEGEAPITQKDLTQLFKDSNVVFKIDPTSPQLSSRDVALLDPFQRRKIEQIEHPLQKEIDAFNGKYTRFCLEHKIPPVPFSSFDFTAKKMAILEGLKTFINAQGIPNGDNLIPIIDQFGGASDEAFLEQVPDEVFPIFAA